MTTVEDDPRVGGLALVVRAKTLVAFSVRRTSLTLCLETCLRSWVVACADRSGRTEVVLGRAAFAVEWNLALPVLAESIVGAVVVRRARAIGACLTLARRAVAEKRIGTDDRVVTVADRSSRCVFADAAAERILAVSRGAGSRVGIQSCLTVVDETGSGNTGASPGALPVVAGAITIGPDPASAALAKGTGAVGVSLANSGSDRKLADAAVADISKGTEVDDLGSGAGGSGWDATFFVLALVGGALRASGAGSSRGAGTSAAEKALEFVNDICERACFTVRFKAR